MLEFNFGEYTTRVFISRRVCDIDQIAADMNPQTDSSRRFAENCLVICDENTSYIADKICGSHKTPRCVLKSGEEVKNWDSVELILKTAHEAGLGRDSCYIGAGGGVAGDLAGFASSIYMRGCSLVLVSTTLLGMTDASVGGKTGFNIFGIKNFAGSFYPARNVYLPLDCLATLPEKEWKSGFAEIIKTAVLDGDDFLDQLSIINGNVTGKPLIENGQLSIKNSLDNELLDKLVERAVIFKGSVVSEDLRESGRRAILNLGHTFGHALEASCGLGNVSHGEAVAWGIVRACELGRFLGITPGKRAQRITDLIKSFGYEVSSPHPLVSSADLFFQAMNSDKKKKKMKLTFIVPDADSAVPVTLDSQKDIKSLKKIITG